MLFLKLFLKVVMLNLQSINQLKTGQTLVLQKDNTIITAKWHHRIIRLLTLGLYNDDKKIAELLITHLHETQNSKNSRSALEAASQFVKSTQKTNAVFKRLENVLFAHRCKERLSIEIGDLINHNGSTKNKLLLIIKNNHLHNVIYKANTADKNTAILIENDQIFIRSKDGENFLNSPEHIRTILKRPLDDLKREHLKLLLNELTKPVEERSDVTIKDLREVIGNQTYCYSSLDTFKTNEKGVFITDHFLADGMEEHHLVKWKEMKAAFVEKSQEPKYKLRVVTRLPEYALSKTTWGFMKGFIRNSLNLGSHGHSWIQLVAPEENELEIFTGRQRVYDVGFYVWPKKLENADPVSYMNLPKELIVVEEMEISKEDFNKGIFYLNTVQSLFLDPKKKLAPSSTIGEEDLDKIKQLYSAIKGSCLSFANGFREVLTGIEVDDRGCVRRWVCPKKRFKKLDKLDPLIEKSGFFKKFFNFISFLNRVELPHFRKPKP